MGQKNAEVAAKNVQVACSLPSDVHARLKAHCAVNKVKLRDWIQASIMRRLAREVVK